MLDNNDVQMQSGRGLLQHLFSTCHHLINFLLAINRRKTVWGATNLWQLQYLYIVYVGAWDLPSSLCQIDSVLYGKLTSDLQTSHIMADTT